MADRVQQKVESLILEMVRDAYVPRRGPVYVCAECEGDGCEACGFEGWWDEMPRV